MLAIVFISSITFCHVYLERFSFHDEQFEGIYGYRLKNDIKEKIKEDSVWLKQNINWSLKTSPIELQDSYNLRLEDYSNWFSPLLIGQITIMLQNTGAR